MSTTNNLLACIGLDGGPCAGKTTGQTKIRGRLSQLGIMSATVPEAASILITSGFTPKGLGLVTFQKMVVELQLQNEQYWKQYLLRSAQKKKKEAVLLCDRGLLSGAAYMPTKDISKMLFDFQHEVLDHYHLEVEHIRSRYNGVLHFVTAANGAEAFYTLANNAARSESPNKARKLDERTQSLWLGHPHLAVIANRDRQGNAVVFDQKMEKAIAETYRILGIPVPLEIEDSYVLNYFNPAQLQLPYEIITIEQRYLVNMQSDVEERVRKRTWLHQTRYIYTIKRPNPDGIGRFETEQELSVSEYEALLEREDRSRFPVYKDRVCFVWKDQYFELDMYHGNLEGLFRLERERTEQNQDATVLPPFLDVREEVTGNKRYGNARLAQAGSLADI